MHTLPFSFIRQALFLPHYLAFSLFLLKIKVRRVGSVIEVEKRVEEDNSSSFLLASSCRES